MSKDSFIRRIARRLGFVFVASVLIMLASIISLTVFYAVVEGDQGRGRSIFDWLYFTVITTRTIGFGDITPQTVAGKFGTIFNALLPASLFFGASLVVLQEFFQWLESSYRRYRMKSLIDHHIIVADEELMESIVQEYQLEGRRYVCVSKTDMKDLPPRLQDMLDQSSYYCGDPTRDEVLEAVNLRYAKAILIATADDNINLYVLVTVKGIYPQIKTIVRVNRLETESKFRSVGADVLLPAGTMLGRMLSQAAVSPLAMELLVRLQTGTAAPNLEEVVPPEGSVSKPVRDVVPAAVAIFRNKNFIFDLQGVTVEAGDVILTIAGVSGR
ncbi:MAG: NAD-binding protein [Planctomycetes bacterium]|nr:NAD-binding protein [Planctomycetota bacterium]